jgi:alpha/beta superfamily hydrolase
VAVRIAGAARPERLVAVAPGITLVPVTDAAPPKCPWLIVQGEQDEVVAPAVVQSWAQSLAPLAQLRMLPAAGHFFHGRLPELRDAVLAFMQAPANP